MIGFEFWFFRIPFGKFILFSKCRVVFLIFQKVLSKRGNFNWRASYFRLKSSQVTPKDPESFSYSVATKTRRNSSSSWTYFSSASWLTYSALMFQFSSSYSARETSPRSLILRKDDKKRVFTCCFIKIAKAFLFGLRIKDFAS